MRRGGRRTVAARPSKHGLKLTVGCNEACTIKLSLTVSAGEARKLHLNVHGKRPVTIASGTAMIRKAGVKTFVLKLSRRLAKALENQKRVSLTLIVSATATARHKTQAINRRITFRR